MKIRTTKLAAGPHGIRKRGTELDLPRKEAEEMIAKGDAEKADEPPPKAKKPDTKTTEDGFETTATEADERAATRTDEKPARRQAGG